MKKIFIAAFVPVIIAASAFAYQKADNRQCERFVKELDINCEGISDLSNYVDYRMLSKELKNHISESDFRFSSNEEMYAFCDKFKDLNYKYEIDNWNYIYPTYKYGRLYDVLDEKINIDGDIYRVSVILVFKPSLMFRPEIVDLSTSVSLEWYYYKMAVILPSFYIIVNRYKIDVIK